MQDKWVVIYRKSWTQQVTRPPERCPDQATAKRIANDFNKSNQDRTWNCEVAIVHCLDEKLRA